MAVATFEERNPEKSHSRYKITAASISVGHLTMKKPVSGVQEMGFHSLATVPTAMRKSQEVTLNTIFAVRQGSHSSPIYSLCSSTVEVQDILVENRRVF